ncbi:hypothetical protein CK203_021548 [Vitis vinifera]|uniref:Uncharacterized protein n=1 Tax=Vitis vinifera TaxID=29760 RepID=A0A438DXN8_VITVI|nr:hypothetical protein CK203_078400 [Vitis vinifera]RVW99668.1 hypothetical protein CK203_021548 [Vitis vinifera]
MQRALRQAIFASMPKKLATTGSAKLVPFESFFHACEVLICLVSFLIFSIFFDLNISRSDGNISASVHR